MFQKLIDAVKLIPKNANDAIGLLMKPTDLLLMFATVRFQLYFAPLHG